MAKKYFATSNPHTSVQPITFEGTDTRDADIAAAHDDNEFTFDFIVQASIDNSDPTVQTSISSALNRALNTRNHLETAMASTLGHPIEIIFDDAIITTKEQFRRGLTAILGHIERTNLLED